MALITLRNGLGRLLTSQEGDDNLTNLNDELALAAARYYGDVDPTTIPGVNVGPGFFWAHQSSGQMKIRNTTNDGWIDLFELFSKIYTRASVVGQVGHSGGIPTGALVQYGSNQNGEFFRFAGGEQWCRSVSTANATFNSETLLQGSATFAASFISAPAFVPIVEISVSDAARRKTGLISIAGTSALSGSCRLNAITGQTFLSNDTVPFYYFAVGRWY